MSIRRDRGSITPNHLDSAHTSLQALNRAFREQEIDRRAFLQHAIWMVAGVSLSPTVSLALSEPAAMLAKADWRDDPWWTLQEVQEHLFPTEKNAPGAKSIQSAAYLKREIVSPKVPEDEKKLIIDGVNWLNDLCQMTQKKPFVEMDPMERESVLRQTEQSTSGQRWLSLLIYYVLEALLSDPIYGGNPDGSGWKWLNHHVGFPRPTKEKIYSKL